MLEARGPGEHASSDRSLFPSLAPLLTPWPYTVILTRGSSHPGVS